MASFLHAATELTTIWSSLLAQGSIARADSGVSMLRQLGEMLWLRAGAGKLHPQDYYKLRVYRRQISFREKQLYMSNRAIPRELTGSSAIVARDKLLTYGLLSQFDIPVPTNYGICHELREYKNSRSLKSVPEIAHYLRYEVPYPLIAKPVLGVFSKDVLLLERYNLHADTIDCAHGAPIAPEKIAEDFLSRGSGYLLQELLSPYQRIREFYQRSNLHSARGCDAGARKNQDSFCSMENQPG
jgi:hypothetical protein